VKLTKIQAGRLATHIMERLWKQTRETVTIDFYALLEGIDILDLESDEYRWLEKQESTVSKKGK